VIGPETLRLRLDDGVELAAGVYRPEAPGRFPVLLMRQPYGHRIASTVVLAHPAWYAAHGYVVVIQDVRGRGHSTGVFRVLADDAADGAATLAWAAELPGGTGQVATYGFSYQAMTQLLALAGAARAGTKTPDALVPAMGAWSVRDDWAYEGDAFRLAANLVWACQIGAEGARLRGDRAAFTALVAAARGTPWSGERPARPEALAQHGPDSHYESWLADDPATWEASAPAAALKGLRLATPGLFVGGWLDGMLEGTLAMHAAFQADGSCPQRLLVGPWLHLPWNTVVGAVGLGPEAASPVDAETLRFLNFHLKGDGEPGPPVRLFDIGLKSWRDFDALPDPEPKSLFLASGGRAATTPTDGSLDGAPGRTGEDRLVHDPWRPAPIVGGHGGQPPGFQDRAALDDRTDVAVYTSAPLERPVDLAGRVAAELHVESDGPSHDLHCTLSVVEPQGRAITLTGGHLRVGDPGVSGPRRVGMRATCMTVPARARLRLSVQAAAFPAFPVNPGTGERPEDAHPITAQVTTLILRHGGATPSRLLVPALS
jgi:putative CocE/NonD family hydrolase